MNKIIIFTVTDTENCSKPIVYARLVNYTFINNQDKAEELVKDYINEYLKHESIKENIEDIAYFMRKQGYGWTNERWCFELTEVFDNNKE